MKKNLRFTEILAVGSMLFGLFFGAGNLIFPAFMGQNAGRNVWDACIGFLVTGVGIPLLSVAALGMSRSEGLLDLSSKIGKGYGYFFTCLLYLTIGPFFAIPRCATTSWPGSARSCPTRTCTATRCGACPATPTSASPTARATRCSC